MDTQTQTARLIVANVAHTVFEGPGGAETFSGTSHFSAGTKVHVGSAFWGEAGERVQVVGPARKSRRWIYIALPAKSLYNFRVAAVGKPAALRKLRAVGSPYLLSPWTEEGLCPEGGVRHI